MMAARQAISAITSKDCSSDDKIEVFFEEFRQFSDMNKVRFEVPIGTSFAVFYRSKEGHWSGQ